MRAGLFLITVAALAPLVTPSLACAQAQPTAVNPIPGTGLNLGLINGTFRYGATASQVFLTGYISGQSVTYQTNLSGNVAYSTKSEVKPFSLVYSGGVQIAEGGGYGNSVFQSLALSQGYTTRNWSFGIADVVTYLPQSPTVGLSGIPGAGDLGLYPVSGIDEPSQDILTYNSNRVTNTVDGTVARRITPRTSINGNASYGLIHFFNNDSLSSTQIGSELGLNHQISPRTSVGVNATYSVYSYDVAGNSSFVTRGLNVQGTRQVTRALAVSASAGPQWVNASSNLGIPSRLSYAVALNATYVRQFGTLSAYYTRGANGGSGVLPGAFSDTVGGAFFRTFGRDWSGSINAGYSRTTGLGSTGTQDLALLGLSNFSSFDSTFAGAQANRRLSKSFSAFASYTASNQSYGNYSNAAPGALNGLIQSFSIGVSFYPRSVNLGQF